MKHIINKKIIALLILAAVTLSVNTHASEDGPNFEKINDNWNAAFNNKDAQAVAALYTERASLSPGNQKVLVGREAIQALFQSFIDAGVHDHAIEVISTHTADGLAYQTSNWSAKGAADKDGVEASIGGVLTSILQRQEDGTWKSMMHIWN